MALPRTPAMEPETVQLHRPDQSQIVLPERFKAYADAPDGITKNKPIVYQTHDIDHSVNLCLRMIKNGWKIRAAYHQFADGRSVKISEQVRSAGLINMNK